VADRDGEIDWQWAREVLVKWLNTARLASSMNNHALAPLGERVDTLWERQDQVAAILRRLNGDDADVTLLEPRMSSSRGRLVSVERGTWTIQAAIGKIDTMAETAARLGTDAPRMPADAMHPVVWSAASRLWNDGHYSAAVQRAATFVNAEIQDKVGRHDVSDAALIRETFTTRPPEVGKPRLRWPGMDDNLTVKAMREGIFSFAVGCFLAIRNPTTHGVDDVARQVALEQLATLSTLARWIDGCELVTAPDVS